MTFQPIVPAGGYAGWLFLERTLEQQQESFDESFPVKRATDYFRENISDVQTAEQLVNDREMLSVALGAFGLSDDLGNKYFIQKILEEGTIDDGALANKLSDSRYAEFSRAFGFGDFSIPLTATSVVSDSIIDRYQRQSFEAAVGEQDNQLRLVLNVDKAIDDVTSSASSTDAQWFSLLGNAPLREVVQTALGLPSEIASVDIDQQLETFKDRAESIFGTDDVNEFNSDELQEKMIRLFLIRSSVSAGAGISSGSIALTLLGNQ
ncbi:MAG: DUF1217 domain-containing protein [Yoonia sp.]|uniref:DUF1217 domain-containing protein n=1 Tax=Yoonia sp. TaxID=2212373 RepID=UPI00327D5DD2